MDLATIAHLLVLIGEAYAFAGIAFCVLVFVKGLSKIDPNSQSSGLVFKLLIIPGIVAFWPFLWKKLYGKKRL